MTRAADAARARSIISARLRGGLLVWVGRQLAAPIGRIEFEKGGAKLVEGHKVRVKHVGGVVETLPRGDGKV